MHPIIIDCVQRLQQFLDKNLSENKSEIELKKVMSKLTMDVIASTAFATRINVYNEEKESPFVTNARNVFTPSVRTFLIFILLSIAPRFTKAIGLSVLSSSAIKFFESAVSITFTTLLFFNNFLVFSSKQLSKDVIQRTGSITTICSYC